tara:strand:+ start:53 stop:289 length:237 start_codon:yes stop_codon:yes gene_type:complete
MPLDKINIVTDFKHLNIRETKEDGGYVRRVLTPDMDVSKEVPKIQEEAEALWTNEVKEKWNAKLEQEKIEAQITRDRR